MNTICKNILTMVSHVPGAQSFPCPLCLAPLGIRRSKKGKPYLVCDICGVQMFVRTAPGIRRLGKLVGDLNAQGVLERLAAFERQNRKTCAACRHAFWATEAALQTHWFNGAFVGYECPECGATVKSERKP